MTTVRRQIAESLKEKPYRDALVKQHLSRWTAAQIRQIREDRGWTQTELGSLVGMGQTSISELEKTGKRQPNIDTLTRIAVGLDVALLVEYVPFSRFVNHLAGVPHVAYGISSEAMSVPSYDEDTPLQDYLSERERPTANTVDVFTTGSVVTTGVTSAHSMAEDALEAYARSLNEAYEMPAVESPAAPLGNRTRQEGASYAAA